MSPPSHARQEAGKDPESLALPLAAYNQVEELSEAKVWERKSDRSEPKARVYTYAPDAQFSTSLS